MKYFLSSKHYQHGMVGKNVTIGEKLALSKNWKIFYVAPVDLLIFQKK